MASQINATQIDETYPIAGQDNDTQGFRDNFNIIKTGLQTAATEVTALQNKTAGLNVSEADGGGDFNGQIISNAVLKQNTNSLLSGGPTASSVVTLNFTNANHQVYQVDRNVEFRFEGFPTNNQASEFILEIRGDGLANHTVSFFTDGTFAIRKSSDFPTTLTMGSGTEFTLIHVIQRSKNIEPGSLENTVFLKYLGVFE